ncbi:ras-related protein Rab-26 isoform X4 [Saccopteryx bilineata]|uniref:ras-related protein Rab-26 isoform X4 n=1 Tax=Saccopteryx bilineata TaxID=59482 RepID=UPI00338F89DD
MSRKKTPKSKGASVPAASALSAANGPRPMCPCPGAPPNEPSQLGRTPLGGGGDFYDVAFKVMLVGDSGVGKTCLLVRFKDGAFLAGTFISTVGIDFRAYKVELLDGPGSQGQGVEVGCLNHQVACVLTPQGAWRQMWLHLTEAEMVPVPRTSTTLGLCSVPLGGWSLVPPGPSEGTQGPCPLRTALLPHSIKGALRCQAGHPGP